VQHGPYKRYLENERIALESHYSHGKHDGPGKEWCENGQIQEEWYYKDGEFYPVSYRLENGEQTLVNGTGKAIRKYGTCDELKIEEYFVNGEFVKEAKLTEVLLPQIQSKG
jgi:antitoxin component YwqK of YwqJK toxin-antitoxin module